MSDPSGKAAAFAGRHTVSPLDGSSARSAELLGGIRSPGNPRSAAADDCRHSTHCGHHADRVARQRQANFGCNGS
jgi:hypothetical protein